MNSQFSHNLKKKLAFKYGLSIDEVNTIVRSVFELTSKSISEGDKKTYTFKNVHIPNFGMFMVKDGRLEYFKNKYGYYGVNEGEDNKGNRDESEERDHE